MAIDLVTGAPGWLATGLVKSLCNDGRKVMCLVQPRIDTSELAKYPVDIIECDITERESFKNFPATNLGSVFHCAGVIHPKKVKAFNLVNHLGTRNLLRLSKLRKASKFIFISSNSAQGVNISRERLMTEEDILLPENAYGRSKYLAELAVKEYAESYNLNATILRPCWYYGPSQPDRQTRFMKMIKSGKPMIFGDGLNVRSMTYISNLIDAMLLADSNPKSSGQTFWIADERPYPTLEIISTIADLLDVEIKPRFIPDTISKTFESLDGFLTKLGKYSPEVHVAGEMRKDIACSIEKAKRILGYSPKVSLREGMRESIEWCRENEKL